MQRVEGACFDVVNTSQLHWCIHKPKRHLSLGSPRRVSKNGLVRVMDKGRLPGLYAAAVLALRFSFLLKGMSLSTHRQLDRLSFVVYLDTILNQERSQAID